MQVELAAFATLMIITHIFYTFLYGLLHSVFVFINLHLITPPSLFHNKVLFQLTCFTMPDRVLAGAAAVAAGAPSFAAPAVVLADVAIFSYGCGFYRRAVIRGCFSKRVEFLTLV